VEHDQQAERHQHLAQTLFAVRHLDQSIKKQFFSQSFLFRFLFNRLVSVHHRFLLVL
jgi:hypothetical protein